MSRICRDGLEARLRRSRIDSRSASELRHLRASHAIAATGAIAVVAAVTAAFGWEARDAIEVMRHTVYPTGRVSTGGDRPLWMLANASLAAPRRHPTSIDLLVPERRPVVAPCSGARSAHRIARFVGRRLLRAGTEEWRRRGPNQRMPSSGRTN